MTNESGALFGLVNLMIRNKLPKELDIPIPLEQVPHINKDAINFNIQPGYVQLGYTDFSQDLYKVLRDAIGDVGDLKRVVTPISEGFYKAQQKKKISYEKKQRRNQITQRGEEPVSTKEDL